MPEYQNAARNFLYFLHDQNAYAKNTLIAFKRALKSWSVWCENNDEPWFLVIEGTVRRYLLHLHDNGRASSTVSTDYMMINMFLEKDERMGQAIPLS